MMIQPTFILLFAFVSQLFAFPLEKRAAPTVTIANGTVVGSTALSVDSFKGIPFAQPPVGSLRLKPPQVINKSFGTINAVGIPQACPQFYTSVDTSSIPASALGLLLDTPLVQTVTNAGEDCLTLNVQRPAGSTASSSLPVVVWIFGGGFEFGSTQFYDGTSLIHQSMNLNQPIIYVAMNYRVGGFGFLAGQDLAEEGSTNLGLRDQRLALQWVQDNIAAFGGDPTKVTIWGESAGSISVFDQTVINGGDNTYNGKPLFRAAIMDSGSIVAADTVTGPSAQAIYNTVVQNAGCSKASNRLDCLRSTDYTTLLNAANSVPGIFSYRSVDLSYLPRPDPSNKFFSVSPNVAVRSGAFAKVPIIIGDQEDEGTLFSLTQSNITTNSKLVSYITSYFPTAPDPQSLATQLLTNYPNDLGASGSPFDTGDANEIYPEYKRLAAVLGDVVFTLTRRVYLSMVASQVPSWSYLSSYLYGTPVLGTFHASDILYSYGILGPNVPTISIQSYYVSFINSLDPNALGIRPPLISWPKWTTSSPQLLNFQAMQNILIPDNFREGAFNFLKSEESVLKV